MQRSSSYADGSSVLPLPSTAQHCTALLPAAAGNAAPRLRNFYRMPPGSLRLWGGRSPGMHMHK